MMNFESSNPKKAKMLCYGLFYEKSDTTMFVEKEGALPTEGGIKMNYYRLHTNDEIPEDKIKEVEAAIFRVLNPKMQTKLSILIPTIVGREEMVESVVNSLGGTMGLDFYLVNGSFIKSIEPDSGVEILICKDNKELSVGGKRNRLLEAANGEYVVFSDDDDRVSDDYASELLEGIKTGADIITFDVSVSIDGATPKPCYYSMYFDGDKNEPDAYYRLPNHLMCVKREIALQVPFKEISFGEDADYALRLKPLLKSEHSINKVLYYYDYNSKTTATQRR